MSDHEIVYGDTNRVLPTSAHMMKDFWKVEQTGPTTNSSEAPHYHVVREGLKLRDAMYDFLDTLDASFAEEVRCAVGKYGRDDGLYLKVNVTYLVPCDSDAMPCDEFPVEGWKE